jgi:small subunit ribosomal protein S17
MAEEEKEEQVEETPAEEPAAEEEPAADEQEPAPAEEPAPAAQAEPEEALHPKQVRKRARSRHEGEARPQRSPEERQGERVAFRREKSQRRHAYRLKRRERDRARRAAAPAPAEPPAAAKPRGKRKVRQGVVVSDRADKTITVRVDLTRRHRLYEKTIRSSSTLHAHDERNEAHVGDTVRVEESRPRSRTKRWRLLEVLERAR